MVWWLLSNNIFARPRPPPLKNVRKIICVIDDEDYVHFDDIEAVKRQIQHDLAADVNDLLDNMAKDFNRRQPRRGFIAYSQETLFQSAPPAGGDLTLE